MVSASKFYSGCTLYADDEEDWSPSDTLLVCSGYTEHLMLKCRRVSEQDYGISVDALHILEYPLTSITKSVLVDYKNIIVLEEQNPAGATASIIRDAKIRDDHNVTHVGPDGYVFENGGRDYIMDLCGLNVENVIKLIQAYQYD